MQLNKNLLSVAIMALLIFTFAQKIYLHELLSESEEIKNEILSESENEVNTSTQEKTSIEVKGDYISITFSSDVFSSDFYMYIITNNINTLIRGEDVIKGNSRSLLSISTEINNITYQYENYDGFTCDDVKKSPLKEYCPTIWNDYIVIASEYINKYNAIIKKEGLLSDHN